MSLALCFRFFFVKFVGNTEGARGKVDKVMSRLYNNGEWLRLSVVPPSSAPTPLYISRDKNRKQTTMEFQTKKLQQALKDVVPSSVSLTVRRAKGLVLADFQKLAQIELTSDDSPSSVLWKPSLLQMHSINKDTGMSSFRTATAAPMSAEEWCP